MSIWAAEENTVPRQQDLDLILVCHVLEHLYDPPATLARFHAALAPNGYLVLEVPCAISTRIASAGLVHLRASALLPARDPGSPVARMPASSWWKSASTCNATIIR